MPVSGHEGVETRKDEIRPPQAVGVAICDQWPVYQGHARFVGPNDVRVNDETLRG